MSEGLAVDPATLDQWGDLLKAARQKGQDVLSSLVEIYNQMIEAVGTDEASKQIKDLLGPQILDTIHNVNALMDANDHAGDAIKQAGNDFAFIDRQARERLAPPTSQRPPTR